MIFNDVDIYSCKFFTLNKEKELQFIVGIHRGKTVEDFKTIIDIHHVTNYLFWIIKNEDIPLVSKYIATEFLKKLSINKFSKLTKIMKEKVLIQQKTMKDKTELSAKETGTKYI